MKIRKEQDVECMFNDCSVMAICMKYGTLPNNETSTVVRGLYPPKVSLSNISSISDHTSRALNHG